MERYGFLKARSNSVDFLVFNNSCAYDVKDISCKSLFVRDITMTSHTAMGGHLHGGRLALC